MPTFPTITFPFNFTDILAAIGIILTIYFYLKSRHKKELSYVVLSDTSVVSIDKKFSELVEVTYLGVKTKTLQLIRLKVVNTGNVHIDENDFKEPLTFVQNKPVVNGKTTGLFTLDFPEKERSDKLLKPETYYSKERVGVKPLLINQGQYFTVDLLNVDIHDKKVQLDVQALIRGGKIKEIKSKVPSPLRSIVNIILGLMLFGLGVSIDIFESNFETVLLFTLLMVFPAFIINPNTLHNRAVIATT